MVMKLIREREAAAAAAAAEAVSTAKIRATKRDALKKITVSAKPDVVDAYDSVITAGSVKKNTPPESAGGLIGGPWDEEKVRSWQRHWRWHCLPLYPFYLH